MGQIIHEHTLRLPSYEDTMSRIVGDYTEIGRVKSNVGGYQSTLIEPEDMPSRLKQCIDHYTHKINDTVSMAHWWINVNGEGHFNSTHDHYDRTPPVSPIGMSGVYYISIPDDNMGDIVFQGTIMRSNPTLYDPPIRISPMTNKLVLFPSDCFHSVEPNMSHQSRMSISFNYT